MVGNLRYFERSTSLSTEGYQGKGSTRLATSSMTSFIKRIPRNKDELRDLEKEDYYRLLRIKEGEVKNKVGSLRQ